MTTSTRPVLTLKRPKRVDRQPEKTRVRPQRPAIQTQRPGNEVDLLTALQARAPDLWRPDAPVPLAVGIHKQLYPIAESVQVSRRSLRKFLSRWTSSGAYQKSLLAADAVRVNLDGSSAGEVSEQHRDVARGRVKE